MKPISPMRWKVYHANHLYPVRQGRRASRGRSIIPYIGLNYWRSSFLLCLSTRALKWVSFITITNNYLTNQFWSSANNQVIFPAKHFLHFFLSEGLLLFPVSNNSAINIFGFQTTDQIKQVICTCQLRLWKMNERQNENQINKENNRWINQ